MSRRLRITQHRREAKALKDAAKAKAAAAAEKAAAKKAGAK